MLRQLIPVFAPLLSKKFPDLLYVGRAIINFMILARYRSYNKETLRYITEVIYRMDLLKEVFRKYRPVNRDTDKGHLNFTKWYAISYYINTIIAYGLLDRYST